MAELHVQRKKRNFGWLWLIVILLIVAVLYYLYKNYYQEGNEIAEIVNFNKINAFWNNLL